MTSIATRTYCRWHHATPIWPLWLNWPPLTESPASISAGGGDTESTQGGLQSIEGGGRNHDAASPTPTGPTTAVPTPGQSPPAAPPKPVQAIKTVLTATTPSLSAMSTEVDEPPLLEQQYTSPGATVPTAQPSPPEDNLSPPSKEMSAREAASQTQLGFSPEQIPSEPPSQEQLRSSEAVPPSTPLPPAEEGRMYMQSAAAIGLPRASQPGVSAGVPAQPSDTTEMKPAPGSAAAKDALSTRIVTEEFQEELPLSFQQSLSIANAAGPQGPATAPQECPGSASFS